jgi:DNA-binding MurR/RpiR family transcriptional regulator
MTKKINSRDELEHRIKHVLAEGTKRQRLVAAYFLEHHEHAIFLSIPQLADEVGVSTSTIVRFAVELGFESFSKFQAELQKQAKERLRPANRLIKKVASSNEIDKRVKQYYEQDIRNIQGTYQSINTDDLDRAVKMFIESRWIWIVGLRGSYPLAHDFEFKLRQIIRKSSLINLGPCDYLESAVMIQPNDLVVGFSFSRFTKETISIVRLGKEKGAKTLTFTDRAVSPVTPYSDLNFVIHVKGLAFVNSYVAVFSLINCLLGEISTTAKDLAVENLKSLDEELLSHDVFRFA